MKRGIYCLACLLGLSASAWAIEPGPSSAQQKQTEAWLQLQPKGLAASPVPQTTTPTEKDLALQRWINSYSHPIPDSFDQKKAGSVKDN
jgi:hypothetical protein